MGLVAAAWLSFASADSVCVKKSLAVLRKGAGDKSAVSWRAPRYMPFVRLETKHGWSKLQDLEGEVHWAHAGDVTNTLRCVVVKANVATLRKEPRPGAAVAEPRSADRYTPFLRVADQEDWLQIKDEAGHVAWIPSAQVWKPVMINAISF